MAWKTRLGKCHSQFLTSEDEPSLSLVHRRTGNETMLLTRGVSCLCGLARDIELQAKLKCLSKLHDICVSMCASVR